ncbi:MAG: hypothetical protein HY982_00980 [Candidatus Magasanikbacteria bacterium]|nr:hypothetical protein [Candidatus Magasanikbacteria bacterium]
MRSKFFSRKNILFIAIFAVLGLLALQVPVTQIVGSKVKFTFFDFFGPVASGFIGSGLGVIAVFLMQSANFFLHGAKVVDAGTIIRFFPMLFAVLYFGRKSRLILLVPLAAIIAFNLHPQGRAVWYFSLYWLIPLVGYFWRDKFLLARALGATFTAHAVGSVLWLYVFNLPAAVWQSLIPVVAMERLLFTIGIVAVYLVLNNILNWLTEKRIIKMEFLIEKKYIFGRLRSKNYAP